MVVLVLNCIAFIPLQFLLGFCSFKKIFTIWENFKVVKNISKICPFSRSLFFFIFFLWEIYRFSLQRIGLGTRQREEIYFRHFQKMQNLLSRVFHKRYPIHSEMYLWFFETLSKLCHNRIKLDVIVLRVISEQIKDFTTYKENNNSN